MTDNEHQDVERREYPREVVEAMQQQGRRERSMRELLGDGGLDRARRAMNEERDR